MALNVALFFAGIALAWLTLRDVFDTVVVPGGSRASLRVARRLNKTLLPVWKAVRGKRHGLSGSFAPLVLVLSFVTWIVLLALGFTLMAFSMRDHFRPALQSIPEALYMVGSSIVTIGVSERDALGGARWIVLASGFCGLAVMTMAVTYLLQVQSSVSKRDIGIIKLNTSAGEPPCALTLLERFAAIRNRGELPQVLREARNWCATVRQSHASHPSLIYFQSTGTASGWPAALGALLDLGLLVQCLDEDDLYGPSVLLGSEGREMARDLAAVIAVEPLAANPRPGELREAIERLERCGYSSRERTDFDMLARQRAEYQGFIDALAEHLGRPTNPLLPKA